jgi:predicted amidohydrolase YtcJ
MIRTLLALVALCWASMAPADILVDDVNGYTIAGKGELVRFTGLVVGDDGKVKQLLKKGDKRPERPDYRLNGRGRTLVPGLIDAHGHVMGLGFSLLLLDLSDTRSLAEAQAKIAAHAAANPSPRWIVGRGWNQEAWGLGRFPTAADIDAVVPGRPVWLERVDGHAGWANSLAMKEAGVTAETQSPAGGRIETAGGAPSGVFVDAAQDLVGKVVPPPLPRARDQAFEAAQKRLLSVGVTAVADMGTSVDDWATIRRSGDLDRLNLRIISYASGIEPMLSIAGTGPTPWLYDSKLRMVGVKIYSDGALGSRGAWLKAPYSDAPGERGLGFLTDATLRNLMSRAAMDGFQTAVHAIGDAANEQLLGAIEELAETYKGDRRWRVEHAQIVDAADIARFGRNGIIASMQPSHEASDWRMAEARLGPDRLGGAYAWAGMLSVDSPIAFGSDFPVESPDPFPALAVAVTREDASGQPAGGWLPEQRVTLPQAFVAFTKGAAYAGFAEEQIGSLEPGRYADFIFIDRDIFTAEPDEIRATRVLETWLGGKKVWERK